MALDVKEKALIRFIAKVLFPLLTILLPFFAWSGLWEHPIWCVGFLTLFIQGIKVGKYLWEKVTRKPKNVLLYGRWAVVTGATSGIGEAFAHELAQRGMNVLIISRTQDKLENTRKDILSESPGVKVEILAHDFTKSSDEGDKFYLRLATVAKSLNEDGGIGLLINNVGTNVEMPEFLQDLPEKEILDIVRVNVEGTVRMTRTILPFMTARRSGAIINVSSGSGNHPTPMLSTYAATKAFINEFSRSLYYEAKHFNVDVLVVTPYYVTSNMYKKPPGILNCSAQRLVKDSLAVLGRYDIAYPYVAHAFLGNLMKYYWATPKALFNSMNKTRNRALNKLATQKSPQKECCGNRGA